LRSVQPGRGAPLARLRLRPRAELLACERVISVAGCRLTRLRLLGQLPSRRRTRLADSAQGHQRRLAPVHPQLLPALPACGAAAADDRHM